MVTMTTVQRKPAKEEHYGFVIYRTAHKDQAQWERFMAYLKHQARSCLISEGNPEFYNYIDWKVMDAAPKDGPPQIRRRFNKWLGSGEEDENPENYRYHACVMVNQPFLDFVDEWMEGKSLEKDDVWDRFGLTFVSVVSRYEDEGDVLVGISFLIPRAGDTIAMRGEGVGWGEIWVPEGEIARPGAPPLQL